MLSIPDCISQIVKRFKETSILLANLPWVAPIFDIDLHLWAWYCVFLYTLLDIMLQIVAFAACNTFLRIKWAHRAIWNRTWLACRVGCVVVLINKTIFLFLDILNFTLPGKIFLLMAKHLTTDGWAIFLLIALSLSSYWYFPESWLALVVILSLDLAS